LSGLHSKRSEKERDGETSYHEFSPELEGTAFQATMKTILICAESFSRWQGKSKGTIDGLVFLSPFRFCGKPGSTFQPVL
jgi:hypothetical protein